ncbi:hypothetical protein L6452_09757 [Arctium lappa]|uniref:Uncharacterized protein n=1 Tax=Arctium lappa TaxID=4217 RepID=A0ACB9DLT6_ARCLA|nr:hypothetical protein L6452_09757 [Arctium lappa]
MTRYYPLIPGDYVSYTLSFFLSFFPSSLSLFVLPPLLSACPRYILLLNPSSISSLLSCSFKHPFAFDLLLRIGG